MPACRPASVEDAFLRTDDPLKRRIPSIMWLRVFIHRTFSAVDAKHDNLESGKEEEEEGDEEVDDDDDGDDETDLLFVKEARLIRLS